MTFVFNFLFDVEQLGTRSLRSLDKVIFFSWNACVGSQTICFVKPTIHLNIALRGITRLPQKKQEPELLYRHLEVPSTGCSGFRTTSTHNSIYLLRLPEETCLSAERILRRFCSRLWGIPLVSPARRLLFSFILFIPSFVLLYFV